MRKLFFRFLIAGGVATASQYLILVVLVELADLDPVFSSAVGFVAGAIVNYAINYVFTYKSSLPHKNVFPKFAATAGMGLIINTSTMYLLFQLFQFNYVVSQVIATGITLVWNFLVNTFWSFSHRDCTPNNS